MRDPLMAIVALSANNVSREASRRSVVPGGEVGAMEAERSLLVLDGVHKQTEVCRRCGVSQRAGGKKISAGFGVSTNIFEGDAAGNFDHAIRADLARQIHGSFRFGGRHVIEPEGFRAARERLAKFALVADLHL